MGEDDGFSGACGGEGMVEPPEPCVAEQTAMLGPRLWIVERVEQDQAPARQVDVLLDMALRGGGGVWKGSKERCAAVVIAEHEVDWRGVCGQGGYEGGVVLGPSIVGKIASEDNLGGVRVLSQGLGQDGEEARGRIKPNNRLAGGADMQVGEDDDFEGVGHGNDGGSERSGLPAKTLRPKSFGTKTGASGKGLRLGVCRTDIAAMLALRSKREELHERQRKLGATMPQLTFFRILVILVHCPFR